MILQRKRGLQAVLVLFQSLLITLASVLCALATFNLFTGVLWTQISRYPVYLAAMAAGLFLESLRRDQGNIDLNPFEESFIRQHMLSVRQTLYAMGALFVYLVVTKDQTISRIYVAVCFPAFYLTFLFSNRYLARRMARLLFGGVRKGRILLIGPPEKAERLTMWLRSKEIFGLETIGVVSDQPPVNITGDRFPWLGLVAEAENVIRAQQVTQVILLELPEQAKFYRELMASLERQGVRLLILNNLEEKLNHPVWYLEDDGLRFIGLRQEPLESPLNRISKRALDIAISLPVVIFILPVVALFVWLIQRFNSPGPLLFHQMRAGLQNNQFEILKFRTMHVNNPAEAQQASRGDSRIYRGGQFLRRLSIDELPQFWNVLQGHMSLVGPRPHLIEHNAQFAQVIASFPIRMVVKPGITGLAQVRGFRGEVISPDAIRHRLQSDIEYLENWRLTLDLVIVARTAVQMLFPPPTAY